MGVEVMLVPDFVSKFLFYSNIALRIALVWLFATVVPCLALSFASRKDE